MAAAAAAARVRARPLVKNELKQLCEHLQIPVVAFCYQLVIGALLSFPRALILPSFTLPKVEQPATVGTYLREIRGFLTMASPAVTLARLHYDVAETAADAPGGGRVAKVTMCAPGDGDDPDENETTRGPENPDFDFEDEDEEDEEGEDHKKDKAARTVQRFWLRRQRLLRPPTNRNPFRHSPFFWNMYDIKAWMTRVFAARTIQRWWRSERSFGLDLLSDMATAAAAKMGGEARELENTFPVSHLRF